MFVSRHALAAAGKIALAFFCLTTQPAGAQPTYRVVEIAPLPGDSQSVPHDINDAGEVVGISGSNNAFIWSAKDGAKKVATVEAPHYFWRQPTTRLQINNRGSAVGPNFTWTKAGGVRYRENVCFPSGGCYVGIGFGGINDNDEVSVSSMTSNSYFAFIHNARTNTYRNAGYNYIWPAYSYNLNNSGVFVGGMFNKRPGTTGAFIRGFINAPFPTYVGPGANGTVSELYDINDAGAAVGQDSGYPYIYYSANDYLYINLPGTAQAINKEGAVVGNVGGRAFIYLKGVGAYYIESLIDPADPNYSKISIVDARGINGSGQIVAVTSSGKSLLLMPSIELLAATPEYVSNNTGILHSDVRLLKKASKPMRGVSADGLSTVMLKIGLQSMVQSVTVSLPTSPCGSDSISVNDSCGSLFRPGSVVPETSVQLTADPLSQEPVVFLAYRAPVDFNWGSEQMDLPERTVNLTIRRFGIDEVFPIIIRRPPVVLIHGNWSNRSAWNHVDVSDDILKRFATYRADYSAQMADGIAGGATSVIDTIKSSVASYAKTFGVATAQVSVVAYSMGGLVAREIAQDKDVLADSFMNKGYIHKMVTMDSPHTGSEFANRLYNSSARCRDMFTARGSVVGKNIRDLSVGSEAIKKLSKLQVDTPKVRVHAIRSSASDVQRKAAEDNYSYFDAKLVGLGMRYWYSCDLLPDDGFEGLLGTDSDLIVSRDSQVGRGLSLEVSNVPSSSVGGDFVHAVDNTLFTVGPSILGETIDGKQKVKHVSSERIRNHLIDRLNRRANDRSVYREMLP